jgi:hypothetical protein
MGENYPKVSGESIGIDDSYAAGTSSGELDSDRGKHVYSSL